MFEEFTKRLEQGNRLKLAMKEIESIMVQQRDNRIIITELGRFHGFVLTSDRIAPFFEKNYGLTKDNALQAARYLRSVARKRLLDGNVGAEPPRPKRKFTSFFDAAHWKNV